MAENATSFTGYVAEVFYRRRAEVTRRWVDALSERLGIRPRRVLPTDQLLDHMPELIDRISQHLREGEEPIELQAVVTDELAALARLRRKQGYDVVEVLAEFQILGRILDDLIGECVDTFPGTPEPRSVAMVAGWLHSSLQVMGTVTASTFRDEEMKDRTSAARTLRGFAELLMHELKSPLGAAEGAALVLQNDEMSADPLERGRFAEIIQRNLKRARSVIDDVRTLALTEGSYANVGRKEPLRRVVDEVCREVASLAESRGVRVEVAEAVPEVVVDASRVEIILLNLVGNAVKYADPAKPGRRVNVGFAPGDGEYAAWIVVDDNGLGIPADAQGRVFQRFFRAHPQAAEGTGLGLSIVKEAVEQIDGHLEFESVPGQGTTFRVALPRAREEVHDTVRGDS